MYGNDAMMKTTAYEGGLMQRPDIKSDLERQITNLEKKLEELKELKGILDSEPKMTRALEIMRNGMGF